MRVKIAFILLCALLSTHTAAWAGPDAAQSPWVISLDGRWQMKDFVTGMGMWKPNMGISLVDPPPDTLQLTSGAHWARVPGSVQRNLLSLGVIDDPYVEDNCKQILWVEDKEWWFVRHFEMPADWQGRLVELKCNMINYQADVWINETWCGRTVGNYQPMAIRVGSALRYGGRNTIFIRLRAPENSSKSVPDLKFLDWTSKTGGTHKRPWVTPTNPQAGEFLISKCLFGWDWGPHIVPVGILQPIKLTATSPLELDNLYIRTQELPAGGSAELAVVFNLSNTSSSGASGTLRYAVYRKGSTQKVAGGEIPVEAAADSVAAVSEKFTIDKPALWWPNRLGEHPMYRIEAELVTGDPAGSRLESEFGVRTLNFATNEDPEWTKFKEANSWSERHGIDKEYDWTVVINGRKVFCQGMNWIPVDAMLDLNPERYRYLLRVAAESGVNMLRVWGEGLYETDDFYRICDSLGIMVWQDFWIGSYSNAQPQERSWQAVKDNVIRTRNHPGLVIYCGGNEFDANRPDRVAQIDKLGELIERFDGVRQFHKASPHGGSRHGGMGITPRQQWNRRYKRFVAEGGYQQSWPPRSDLLKFLEEDQLFPLEANKYYLDIHNAEVAHYPHENDEVYGVPRSLDELIHIQMMNNVIGWQSELENTRLARFKVSGCLFWNLNAVWPTTSWAMVDYYGTCKHSYYAFKRAASPLLATASQQYPVLKPGEPFDLQVELINDYLQPMKNLKVVAAVYLGQKARKVYSKKFACSVGAYAVGSVGRLDWTVPDNPQEHNFLLRLDVLDSRGKLLSRNEYTCMIGDSERNSVSGGFFGEYRQWAVNDIQPQVKNFPQKLGRGEERPFEITYRNTSGNAVMALETLITDLPDGIHVYLDDNYVNLLPGERKVLHGSLQVSDRAPAELKLLELTLQVDGWNVARQAQKFVVDID